MYMIANYGLTEKTEGKVEYKHVWSIKKCCELACENYRT